MLLTSSPEKSLKIKQDDKFFSRLVSKETSISNPSFRVYYGGVSGAVPFMWESQPGTPINKFNDTFIPPLTPPPSYYNKSEKPIKKHSRSKLFYNLFPKRNLKKAQLPSSLSPSSSISSSSSSWLSSNSSMSVPTRPSNIYRKRQFSSPQSSFDNGEEAEEVTNGSTNFGINREKGGGVHGGYWVVFMKKALLSVVGRGSG